MMALACMHGTSGFVLACILLNATLTTTISATA
jgi:hypothetical protein